MTRSLDCRGVVSSARLEGNEMEMRKLQMQACRLLSTPADESESAFLQAARSCVPRGRTGKGWARALVGTQLQLGITWRTVLDTHRWPAAVRASEWVLGGPWTEVFAKTPEVAQHPSHDWETLSSAGKEEPHGGQWLIIVPEHLDQRGGHRWGLFEHLSVPPCLNFITKEWCDFKTPVVFLSVR